jgi:hypothetical protein
MNYKDLQNIAFLSQEILTESATQEHNALDRWPYTSPYLQESTEVSEERAPGVKEYQPRNRNPLPIEKPPSGEKGDRSGWNPNEDKYSDWKLRVTPSSSLKKKSGETETVSQRMDREHPYTNRLMGPLGREQGSRISSEVTRVVRGPGEPRAAVTLAPPPDKKNPSREIVRKPKNEEYDLYDVILSHLLDEGYADTYESAEAIMVNMSEDWRESICEEYDIYEERKDPPVSRMSKQARRKAFRLGNEVNDPESGIGLNVKDDPTAKQLRNMARVGGKQVKSHIKKGYEQGRLYDPQNAELNWKRNSKG